MLAMPNKPASGAHIKNSRHDVALVMGSQSDWPIMQHAAQILEELEISHEARIVSAHRTPWRMAEFAEGAHEEGFKLIIAGAGGAAHLPGMIAAYTILPVIGVPVPCSALKGWDSLLSIAQMPGGVPVATMAIGKPGAINAALIAARIIGLCDEIAQERLANWQSEQTKAVPDFPDITETALPS